MSLTCRALRRLANAAFVGAKTVSWSPLVSAALTAGSAQPTASTRVENVSGMLDAMPTIVPDDLAGGTTGDAANVAGTIESRRAPAPTRAMSLRIPCFLLGTIRVQPLCKVCARNKTKRGGRVNRL